MQGLPPGNGIPAGSGPIPQPDTDTLWSQSSLEAPELGWEGKTLGNTCGKPERRLRDAEDGCVSFPPVCGCDLAQSGFFFKNQEYICTHDYQQLYGTRCDSCGDFITGEVISALGRTYHPKCFVCSTCRWVGVGTEGW